MVMEEMTLTMKTADNPVRLQAQKTPLRLQAREDTAETAGAEDNDTAGVEPTSFNLQPGTTTTSPQLTFVSTDGGDAPPASNTDIA